MPKKSQAEIEKELTKEVRKLSKEVKKLKNIEFMRVFKHPFKFMWFSFLKGLMVGFGSVLGASLLVGIFIYILAQISFVPIIGEFVEEVITTVTTSEETSSENGEMNFLEEYEATKDEIETEIEEELEEPQTSL